MSRKSNTKKENEIQIATLMKYIRFDVFFLEDLK